MVRVSRTDGTYNITGLGGLTLDELQSALSQAYESIPAPDVVIEGCEIWRTTELLSVQAVSLLYQRLPDIRAAQVKNAIENSY